MTNSLSLYPVKNEFMKLFENDNLSEEEMQEKGKILALELTNKSTDIIGYYRNNETSAEMIDKEIERLKGIKDTLQRRNEKLKAEVQTVMEQLDIEKIETPLGILSIAKNPPSVEILNETDIPDEFKKEKVTIVVDKTAIKKHFMETEEAIPGATVRTDKKSLRIN